MNKDNNSFDEVFEILLKKAAVKADEELGEGLDEPDTDVVFSERHEKNMQQMFRREARKIRMKQLARYSKRCACILVVLVAVATVSVLNVDALKIRFLHFKPDPSKPNADFYFRDDKSTYYRDGDINIDYIPEGFELTEVSKVVDYDYVFENGDMYFAVSRSDIETEHNLDTENMTIEQLKIRGHDATLMTRPSLAILVWYTDYDIYIIFSNLPKEEVVKIGENTV